jgi:hypothetical protein
MTIKIVYNVKNLSSAEKVEVTVTSYCNCT